MLAATRSLVLTSKFVMMGPHYQHREAREMKMLVSLWESIIPTAIWLLAQGTFFVPQILWILWSLSRQRESQNGFRSFLLGGRIWVDLQKFQGKLKSIASGLLMDVMLDLHFFLLNLLFWRVPLMFPTGMSRRMIFQPSFLMLWTTTLMIRGLSLFYILDP